MDGIGHYMPRVHSFPKITTNSLSSLAIMLILLLAVLLIHMDNIILVCQNVSKHKTQLKVRNHPTSLKLLNIYYWRLRPLEASWGHLMRREVGVHSPP